MNMYSIVLSIFTVVFAGCGYGNGGNGDGSPNCPDMSGNWQFEYNCPMSSRGQSAEVTQDGCDITSLWKDDNTPAVYTLTGTVDEDGNTTVTIDFGDSVVTCTGLLSGSDWTSDCTPGDCQMNAEKL